MSHILQLRAENFKRIKIIDIKPDTSNPIVTLSGKNEAGKTSALDAISTALSGYEMPDQPIRGDAKRAIIKLNCGEGETVEFTITKTITQSGARLTIEDASGIQVGKKPQEFLEKVFGTVSIDPTKFLDMKPQDQRSLLLKITGVDVDGIDNQLKEKKKELTEKRRIERETEDRFAKLPFHEDLPLKELQVIEVVEKRDALKSRLEKKTKNISAITEIDNIISNTHSSIEIVEKSINDLLKKKQEYLETIESQKKIKEELAQIVASETISESDVEAANAEIIKLDATNEKIRQNIAREAVETELNNAIINKELCESELESLEKQRIDTLKAAKFPIDDLDFCDEGILYKGKPFSQASSAARLKTAVAIAMAQKPKLRVIRITNASLLDQESQKVVHSMAVEHGYQVWEEIVDDSGKIGFYIEDGELKK